MAVLYIPPEGPDWYSAATLDRECTHNTHCDQCAPEGDCDACFTIDGRQVECVAEYASTCDGCSNLTLHEEMVMNKKTQLGYCKDCRKRMAATLRKSREGG